MSSGHNNDLTNLEEVSFEVKFVLQSTLTSLKELKALREGSKLPLISPDLSDAALEVNGQKIASGRIIDAGDCFALQILRIGK